MGVDRFYMTAEALEKFRNVGDFIWADCRNEYELIQKIRENNPRIIISEYFQISEKAMAASESLRGVVAWGVGYDHVDVEAASKRGIYVANTRGSNAESVAEHAFSLILALSRRIVVLDNFVKTGRWSTREESGIPSSWFPVDLYGKILGIIGFGAIGSRVARIASGFGMRIIVFDPYLTTQDPRLNGIQLVGLKQLLKESDFVTVHVSLNKETRGMIGEKELNLMKHTAYLINTSRGPVVDEGALVAAITKGKIAGAGLDVFENEPIEPDNPLLGFDNVVLSPHIAGGSVEALNATALTVSEEAIRILNGQVPKNLVNKSELEKNGYLVGNSLK